jgi:hypothetical protein
MYVYTHMRTYINTYAHGYREVTVDCGETFQTYNVSSRACQTSASFASSNTLLLSNAFEIVLVLYLLTAVMVFGDYAYLHRYTCMYAYTCCTSSLQSWCLEIMPIYTGIHVCMHTRAVPTHCSDAVWRYSYLHSYVCISACGWICAFVKHIVTLKRGMLIRVHACTCVCMCVHTQYKWMRSYTHTCIHAIVYTSKSHIILDFACIRTNTCIHIFTGAQQGAARRRRSRRV